MAKEAKERGIMHPEPVVNRSRFGSKLDTNFGKEH